MTDDQARQLLDLIALYLREYGEAPDSLTVAQLVTDLEGSLA